MHLLRRSPQVTICVPAYRAEAFIATTLRFASGQTSPRLRIVVSVDASGDATAEVCRGFARADARVDVFEQQERLGWARNVNFLLDRVDTPYFCLYFHDDVLLPQYVDALMRALERAPDAVSAHCDMGHHGGHTRVSVGRTYSGSPATRLLTFLLAPERGSPLRSLTKSSVLESLRMPTDAVDGLWANEPYLLRLLAIGPAVHVPETLYVRWTERSGGLTEGWKRLSAEQLVEGFHTNTASYLRIVDAVASNADERAALRHAVLFSVLPRIREIERQAGVTLIRAPRELHPDLPDLDEAPTFDTFGKDVQGWARSRHARVLAAERKRAG